VWHIGASYTSECIPEHRALHEVESDHAIIYKTIKYRPAV
jgi:hypothetical protein